MLVKRLREIRVLESFLGFLRQRPRPECGSRLSMICARTGCPGIEVVGEGVFLRLEAERLRSWEAQPAVRSPRENHTI